MTFNSISGIVRDEANQEVANATVALIKQDGGSIVEYTATDTNGFYEFFYHPEADATEENWHVAVYDDVSPIFNSFSKPYVSAALNLGIGATQANIDLGGFPAVNGPMLFESQYTGISPSSTLIFQEPVAYSNLIAWYPFDADYYGGSNADDATGGDADSGDSTSYDATPDGASFVSGGGVTDVNAGANSGAYELDGTNDYIEAQPLIGAVSDPASVTGWFNLDDVTTGFVVYINSVPFSDRMYVAIGDVGSSSTGVVNVRVNDNGWASGVANVNTNVWYHYAWVADGSTLRFYLDGTQVHSESYSGAVSPDTHALFGYDPENLQSYVDGTLDDIRIYDTDLSGTQVNQIYQNTKP